MDRTSWIVSGQLSSVTQLRALDGALLGTIPLPSAGQTVAFDGSSVWITSPTNNSVSKM